MVQHGYWCHGRNTYQLLPYSRRSTRCTKSKGWCVAKLPCMCVICYEVCLLYQWVGRVSCRRYHVRTLPPHWSHNPSRKILSGRCRVRNLWFPACSIPRGALPSCRMGASRYKVYIYALSLYTEIVIMFPGQQIVKSSSTCVMHPLAILSSVSSGSWRNALEFSHAHPNFLWQFRPKLHLV